MKQTFQQFHEHLKSNTVSSLRTIKQAEEYCAGKLSELQTTIAILDEGLNQKYGLLLVYEFKENDQSHIMLKSRELQTFVGFVCLSKTSSERWEVLEVVLTPELRKQGLGTELYLKIASLGYKIQSGKILSDAAEKMWKKLGAAGRAQTLDTETDKLEPFNLKPAEEAEGNFDPMSVRYAWVLEAEFTTINKISLKEYWQHKNISSEQIALFESNQPVPIFQIFSLGFELD